jgi:hypothetical protein
MKLLLAWAVARLREPSSYAGLAAILVSFHLCRDCADLAATLTSLGIGAAGLASFFLAEKK